MPKVSFQETGVNHEAEAGASILDLCNDVDSGIMFGCRGGMCGTCLTTVVEGKLVPAGEQEKGTLDAVGAEPNQRLSCQAKLGETDVVLTPA